MDMNIKDDNTVLRIRERSYLLDYVREMRDSDVAADQLRCLWTTYCLHYHIQVDTYSYDTDLMDVWQAMAVDGQQPDCGDWSDFDSFDGFMCRYLV